jgi:hypothetical protein
MTTNGLYKPSITILKWRFTIGFTSLVCLCHPYCLAFWRKLPKARSFNFLADARRHKSCITEHIWWSDVGKGFGTPWSFSSHGARSTEVPASCGTARWHGGWRDLFFSSCPELSWPGLPSTFTWAQEIADFEVQWRCYNHEHPARNWKRSEVHPHFWMNESW